MHNLSKRLLLFSVRTIKYVRTLPKGHEYQVISYQLIKSSTSVGANYEEAQAGVSKADFQSKDIIKRNNGNQILAKDIK